jgi:tetratricopeptide (TPR) repeat protein
MADQSVKRGAFYVWVAVRIAPRICAPVVAVLMSLQIIFALSFSAGAQVHPLKGQVTVNTSGGYARLVFRFDEEPEAQVRLANGIVVINFKRPVEVAVDRISTNALDYVAVARRDPDGSAVRIALRRKVTINSMAAGERLFVDLLPESWTGVPPGLPQEVIEELAKRASEAEKKLRQQQQLAKKREIPMVRVRVGSQPTFTRYVFDLPELTPVGIERAKDNLVLNFDRELKIDLADALAALPPTLSTIESKAKDESIAVRFDFVGTADTRTFREDNSFVVDVFAANSEPPDSSKRGGLAALTAPVEGSKGAAARLESKGPAPAGGAQAKQPEKQSAPAEGQKNQPPPRSEKPDRQMVEQRLTAPAEKMADASAASEKAAPPMADPPGSKQASDAASGMQGVQQRPEAAPRNPAAPVVVGLRRQGETLHLTFPFASQTPAAVFRRADTLWLVFDAAPPIDISAMIGTSKVIRTAAVTRSGNGQVVRLKLDRPKLTSLGADGATWTVTLGDVALEPTQALVLNRSPVNGPRATVSIPFDAPQKLHRISDPEAGDAIFVVTALGPARGFLKTQNFIEFRALASIHGVAIQPLADDVTAEMSPDKIVVGRPPGLTLSNIENRRRVTGQIGAELTRYRPFVFDAQLWGFDRQAEFQPRQTQLIRAAAAAPESKRAAARLDLVRFYLAQGMYPEAKSVLDVVLADGAGDSEEPAARVLRAVANTLLNRATEAIKDLSSPVVKDQHDAPLWRALAYARARKWGEAHDGFSTIETSATTLPIELQRVIFQEAVHSAVEVRDFEEASNKLHDFEMLGVPHELEPRLEVLRARVAEGLGRVSDALILYRNAADSWDRPAASEARLRETLLRSSIGEIKRPEAISALESLTTAWRGDDTEIESLQLLARLYTEEGRYRDAFHVMRTAFAAHPHAELTQRIQDEAANTFDSLFLAGKGDALPAIEALSLFYDFRELTPVGRRGDEMIRRLAERLVSVDLLDQAAALLRHQVENRLHGAARAQIAIRLAVVYLMNRKPDRAIQILRSTQTADLPNELRNQRLLLESRALSDTGRNDLAYEVIANIQGKEADRLRADIMWASRRWREAGEQIERNYGERWRDFTPLSDTERADILRAAIAYALADDTLGLDRFRQKYAAKMAEGPDRRAFEIVTASGATGKAAFADIAKAVSSIDTLDNFLRDIRARFPEAAGAPATPPRPSARERQALATQPSR